MVEWLSQLIQMSNVIVNKINVFIIFKSNMEKVSDNWRLNTSCMYLTAQYC